MVPARVTAYIGIGSNLGEPARQIARVFTELAALPESTLHAQSPLYKSRPLGPQDQPDFVNAVAALETGLAPLDLLRELQTLEVRHGRPREHRRHWGPRSLDLDMLLYDALCMQTTELTLPHPGLHQRSFVLWPLADVAPDLVIPEHGPVRVLRDACSEPPIERYREPAGG
ncbi:MAG: 2-amino-4-hydroxy-6-hydroxymethyldihydropteridine diphosphokinase [Gammaproteobacteria bacterium]